MSISSSPLPCGQDPGPGQSFASCPCQQQRLLALVFPSPAEWMPLDELRGVWADFAREATIAPALLASSLAFHALSLEVSAHWHYTLSTRLPWPAPASGHFPDKHLVQAGIDLQEASSQWHGVAYWLERLANAEGLETGPLDQLRDLLMRTRTQHTRVAALLKAISQQQDREEAQS